VPLSSAGWGKARLPSNLYNHSIPYQIMKFHMQ
jgi:hypothetical protein